MTQKTAIVTGASRGLGLELTRFLAESGWRVVVTARGAEALHDAARRLHGLVVAVPGDVTDAAHRARLVEAAGDRIDLLVNNASELGPMRELVQQTPDQLRGVLETNLVSPLAMVAAALPALEAAGGLVVTISSDAAVGGYETWGGYGASKAALDLAALTLANELRPRGIGVVAVDPGDMRTQMHQQAFPSEDISDRPLPDVTIPFWAWLLGRTPLEVSGRRFGAQADTWEVAA